MSRTTAREVAMMLQFSDMLGGEDTPEHVLDKSGTIGTLDDADKAYIEQIMVNTITFTYEENRPRGLCRAERLVYVTTAGGYVGDNDFGYTYIRAIGEMLGIPRCVRVCAEGLDIQGNDGEALLAEAIAGVPAALAE